MSAPKASRRRWTDTTIESELRARCAEFGHFPTRAELVASGLRGLWDAMRSTDGVEAWQARIEAGPSPSHEEIAARAGPSPSHEEIAARAGPSPSHEEIAARAYELYESDAPGDHLAHWQAAERQLASRSQSDSSQ